MLMDRIKIQCWWDKQNLVSGENFVAGFTKVRIITYSTFLFVSVLVIAIDLSNS